MYRFVCTATLALLAGCVAGGEPMSKTALLTNPSAARSPGTLAGFEASIRTGVIRDGSESGFALGGSAGYAFDMLSVDLDLDYGSVSTSDSIALDTPSGPVEFGFNADLDLFQVGPTLRFRPLRETDSIAQPYILAGLGIGSIRADVSALGISVSDSDMEMFRSLGLGVDFRIPNTPGIITAEYKRSDYMGDYDGSWVDWFMVGGGVSF